MLDTHYLRERSEYNMLKENTLKVCAGYTVQKIEKFINTIHARPISILFQCVGSI
jgi:hypothetical protein